MWECIGMLVSACIAGGASIWSANQARKASRTDAERQNEWNRENYEYEMKEGPSLARQGLEKAGYNPLLAVSGGLSTGSIASAQMANSPQADLSSIVSSGKIGAMIGKEIEKATLENEQTRKQNDILDIEKEVAEATRDTTVVEMQNRGMEADAVNSALKGFEPMAGASPAWHHLRQAYLKQAETEEYNSSRWRAIMRDVIDSVHGVSSAYGDVFRKKNKLGK